MAVQCVFEYLQLQVTYYFLSWFISLCADMLDCSFIYKYIYNYVYIHMSTGMLLEKKI